MRLGAKIIEIFSWLFSSLIILRFVLKILGASTTAAFALWLYNTTDSLMAPFIGIFPTPTLGSTSVIDLSAIFAVVVYIGAGYFIAALLESLDNNLAGRIKGIRPQKAPQKPQTPVMSPTEYQQTQQPPQQPPMPQSPPPNPYQDTSQDLR